MKKKEAISVNKMIYVISRSPKDMEGLKAQLQRGNVELFEKLFKIITVVLPITIIIFGINKIRKQLNTK